MIGFALCGSYCTHKDAIKQLRGLIDEGYEIEPIVSDNVYCTDTRFGTSKALAQSPKLLYQSL